MGKFTFAGLLMALLLLPTSNLLAVDYYVSNSGNDSNTGTSPSTAWGTISKINASTFNSGDRILFERGGVFTGEIQLNLNGVIIGAYGTGEKPVISGYAAVSGWVNQGGNIWKAPSPNSGVRILQVGDVVQPLGRYPNDYWLRYSRGSGEWTLIDDNMGFSAGHWNGGEIVFYSSNWTLDACKISSHTETTFNLAEKATYNMTDPYASDKEYFIQNHPNTLDQQGEWACYNSELYIYSTTDPNTLNIKASAYNNGYTTQYPKVLRNAAIENLKFEGFNNDALFLDFDEWDNGDGISITNCDFENIGYTAIFARTCHNMTVDGCTFNDILNDGVYAIYSDYLRVDNSYFENIGMIYGQGGNGNETYSAIVTSSGQNPSINHNTIRNVGYNAVSVAVTQDPEVTYNYVDGACLTKTDGGALYTWHRNLGLNDGGIFDHNIVKNVWGSTRNVLGTEYLHNDVYAIYIDDDNEHMTISNNIISDVHIGIFIHNSPDVDFINNTVHNYEGGMLFRANRGGDSPLIGNCDVTGNTFVFKFNQMSDLNKHYTMKLWWNRDTGLENSIPENNTFENNYYMAPFFSGNIIRHLDSYTYDDYDFSRWQSTLQGSRMHDQNSKVEPLPFSEVSGVSAENFIFFDYAHKEAKTINLVDNYLDKDGVVVSGSVTIEPFTALVLFRTNETYNIADAIPTNLKADEISDAHVALSWQPAVGSVGVVGYQVYRDGSMIGTSANTTYIDSTVAASTPYSYQVLAYDASNDKSGLSAAISVTTNDEGVEVPDIANAIPINLQATSITNVSVSLSWQAAAGNYNVVGYEIYRNGAVIGTSSSTSYSDNTVSASTMYSYQVRAFDAQAGTSDLSVAVSVTTEDNPPQPDNIADLLPTGLITTNVTETRINITWDIPTGDYNIIGYEVYRDGTLLDYAGANSYEDNTVSRGTSYIYQVLAYDGQLNKSQLSSALPVTTPGGGTDPGSDNKQPIIIIEYDVISHSGTLGTIDASSSYDADGDVLQYFWNVPADVSVHNSNSPVLNYLAPDVNESQSREVELIVSDGRTTESRIIELVIAPYKPSVEEIKVLSMETSNYDDNNYPENVLDGNHDTYWSATGDDVWLCMELEKAFDPSHLKIAYYNGEQRKARFDLYVSNDNVEFELIEESVESCGYSSNPHVHDFPEVKSADSYKFVKLIGRGSDIDKQNTLSEIKVYGLTTGSSATKERLETIVNVYPIPAISTFTVDLEKEAQVRLMDLNGKVVMEKYMQAGLNLEVVSYPPGQYILQVVSNNKALSRTLIIQ